MKKILSIVVLSLSMVFGFSALALGANSNNTNGTDYFFDKANTVKAPLSINTTDDANDNKVNNANNTGAGVGNNSGDTLNQVIKSEGMVKNDGTTGTQRTHGEYQNNTNSCASCHQTHTAAAKSLLFKDGVYTTCTACHDGTLGFYNVFSNGDEASTAGTFGGDNAGNASVHLATGVMKVSAAPGGKTGDTDKNSWGMSFNCASCHSAHGSYSDRLLNYNPNNMGNTAPAAGGIKAAAVPVLSITEADKTALTTQALVMDPVKNTNPLYKYVAVRGTEAALGISDDTIDPTDTVIAIFEWKAATTNPVAAATYTLTTNPWLDGENRGTPNQYWASLWKTDTADYVTGFDAVTGNAPSVVDAIDTDVTFHYGKGYASAVAGGQLDSVVKADIGRAYAVKMDTYQIGDFGGVKITKVNESAFTAGTVVDPTSLTTNLKPYVSPKDPTKVAGLGIALSGYCAACHTDYMNKAGSATGTFNTTSYRHNTTSDSYTCVRCHFAHGTDVEIMQDAQGKTITDLTAAGEKFDGDVTTATNYMLDQNPSSALKRFTNMAVCFGCHTSSKASQLLNNDYLQNIQTEEEHPEGLVTSVPTVPTSTDHGDGVVPAKRQ